MSNIYSSKSKVEIEINLLVDKVNTRSYKFNPSVGIILWSNKTYKYHDNIFLYSNVEFLNQNFTLFSCKV
jgi:hypothetical protein